MNSNLFTHAPRSQHFITYFLIAILLASSSFSGCTTQPTVTSTVRPTTPPPATIVAAESPTTRPVPATPTHEPTATILPATPQPQFAFSLKPGENYFSLGNGPEFIFSRNLAAYVPVDYSTLLDWTRAGDSKLVRLNIPGIVMGGTGYNTRGELDEAWAKRWDKVFDDAASNNIYVWVQISGWGDWKVTAPGDWAHNPFNAVNGGPASQPEELFVTDSPTQKLWLGWLKQLINRCAKDEAFAANLR